jgi:hypothetical protein
VTSPGRGRPGPTLSVVVPIHDSASTLQSCIDALMAAAGPDDEIIVADDGSTDGGCATLEVAAGAITEVASDTNIGRGPIRNLGAAAASGDVIVFVDSDVAVHPDALSRLRTAFSDDPDCVAVIGSYDDTPAAPGVVSQYRNLLHHYTHHTRGPTATHFWTGLGAVRRDVFVELGGLDEDTWARNMEDVEFGHRVVDAGYTIVVLPEVQGTHHKRFTLATMASTDLFNRAIPWSNLMLDDGLRTDPFVASWPQATSAAAACTVVGGLVAWPFTTAGGWVAAGAAVVFIGVNAGLWGFLARSRSVGFAVAAMPLHLIHALLSAVGFAAAVVSRVFRRRRSV